MLTRISWFVMYGGHDDTKEPKWDTYIALYEPYKEKHRQFELSITSGFGNGVGDISENCNAEELLGKMAALGPIEALTAVDFYHTSEDDCPPRRMSIIRRNDAYVLIFHVNNMGWFTPVVPGVEFLRFMRGVQRMLTANIQDADETAHMGCMSKAFDSEPSASSIGLGEFGAPEMIGYSREHSDDTVNRSFLLTADLYPKTGMCSMDVIGKDKGPVYHNDPKKLFCDANQLMAALNCEDKGSALELLDWSIKGCADPVHLRVSGKGDTVEVGCDCNGVVHPVCVMSRVELARFLDGVHDNFKREMLY